MKKTKKWRKWLLGIVLTPLALFLLLAILLYIPPVQNWAVGIVASSMGESLGMKVSVGKVRLAFPLDLGVHSVRAVESGDTLLDLRSLRLNVRLLPLLHGRADVDGFELYGLKLDTKSYLSDIRLQGTVGQLSARARTIDWVRQRINVNRATLRDANVRVVLSDTAQKDTTTTPVLWRITVVKAEISRTAFDVRMPGDSMRIAGNIGNAILRRGNFDLGKESYSAGSFTLRESSLRYDLPFAKPTEGIDPNHLALTDFSLMADTIAFRASGPVVRAGLRGLTLRERCGLDVRRVSGQICMDSSRVRLSDFALTTPYSRIQAQAAADLNAFEAGKGGLFSAKLDANVGRQDLLTLGGAYVDKSYLKAIPRDGIALKAEADGNIDRLRVAQFGVEMPGVVRLDAKGHADKMLHPQRSGALDFRLTSGNLAAVRSLLPASVSGTVNLPDGLTAQGKLSFKASAYQAQWKLRAAGGTLDGNATARLGQSETYRLEAQAKHFPLQAFLKDMPLTPLSGQIRLSGSGLDVLSPRATLQAEAELGSLNYGQYDLSNLRLAATHRQGQWEAKFRVRNTQFKAVGKLQAALTAGRDPSATARLQADIESVDLFRLGLTKDTFQCGTMVDLQAMASGRGFSTFAASGSFRGNHFSTLRKSMMAKDLEFDVKASPDTTAARIAAGDLILRLNSGSEVRHLSAAWGNFAEELSRQLDQRVLDQERLKQLMPPMQLYVEAGRSNPLYNIARFKGYSFTSAYVNLNSDPHQGMTGEARLGNLKVDAFLLDTLYARVLQDSTGVQMYTTLKNYTKGNPHLFEVQLKSYMLATGAGIEAAYYDSDGEKGVDVGVRADVVEGGLQVHVYPEEPVLAYRGFKVNADNYLFLGKDHSVRADLDLLADDGTGVKLYGEPKDSVNDLTLSVNRLNLGELSSVLPYMPVLKGMLSGDIRVTNDPATKQLTALASLEADDFAFEGTELGDIGLQTFYLPREGGQHQAWATVQSGGQDVLSCSGIYSDSDGGTFEGNAQLHDFPLQMLNGFLSGTDVALSGKAQGDIQVSGSTSQPLLEGKLDLDSAHIYSDVYGFDFRTAEEAVEIKDSKLQFNDYKLYSTGSEPLVLNGTFDMSDLSRMEMDFRMNARNFELINTGKKAQSMVFGKVYANYVGTLKGTPDNLSIRGKLEVLERTDMTYILKDSPLSVDDRLHDLVQFADFSDTTQVVVDEPTASAGIDMMLGISVSDAAQFHCNLSEDGQSYVNLEGGGDLTLRLTEMGDMRLTGRFTANSGQMKYSLPVIPLKTFQLVEGSYVEFTGDVLNPTLNIEAKESTKAVVSENGEQKSVAFNVGVKITKPLADMGLEFTIEAPEDLNVQNELASMSDEQRSKAAVTLMATGMFMTDESMLGGSGFKAGNALNAFLQSEIQNIAGSALKTIDINLGVESGTSATGTSTTDYSFQFAKRFWGNRISIIIGGKVSTGQDAQNSAESFINNVSVEYRLDQGASRYVRVFYDRDVQDPLEGTLTKTGAGLVLRRKTDRLGELFVFRKKKSSVPPPQSNPQ